jgi:hypothetical protein
VARISLVVGVALATIGLAPACSDDASSDPVICIVPGPVDPDGALSVSFERTPRCAPNMAVDLVVRSLLDVACSGNIATDISGVSRMRLSTSKRGAVYEGTWTALADPSENPENTVSYRPGETRWRVRLPSLAPGHYRFSLRLVCASPTGHQLAVPFDVARP